MLRPILAVQPLLCDAVMVAPVTKSLVIVVVVVVAVLVVAQAASLVHNWRRLVLIKFAQQCFRECFPCCSPSIGRERFELVDVAELATVLVRLVRLVKLLSTLLAVMVATVAMVELVVTV